MKRERNQVGTCPCPVSACIVVCPVYRFVPRTADTTRQRLANKFYMRCTCHGTLGALGESAIQEHIMENGTIWGANHNHESDAAPDAVQAVEAPKPAPDAAPPAKPPTPSVTPRPPRIPTEMDRWMWSK
jgi:hypothetical protein